MPKNPKSRVPILPKRRDLHLLMVEDEYFFQEELLEQLNDVGYRHVAMARSAEEALHLVSHRPFDIALVDINLNGETSGIDLAFQLLDRYELPSIFITAHEDDYTIEQAKQARPLAYLLKPTRKRELKASLEIAYYRLAYDDTLRLAQKLEEEKEFKETLLQISEAVARIQDRGQLLKVIFERIQPIIPFGEVTLVVFDNNQKRWVNLAGSEDFPQASRKRKHRATNREAHLPPDSFVIYTLNHTDIRAVDHCLKKFPANPYLSALKRTNCRELMFTPLRVGNTSIGAILLEAHQENTYSQSHLPLFKAIADLLAVAVSNVLAREEIRKQEQEEAFKFTLIHALNQGEELEQKLLKLSQVLSEYFPFHLISFVLPGEGSSEMHYWFEAISFGEYRRIELGEWLDLNAKHLSLLPLPVKNYDSIRYQNEELRKALDKNPLLQALQRSFHFNSFLQVALPLGEASGAFICFFHRGDGIYEEEHENRWQRFQPSLALALEKQINYRQILRLNERIKQENANLTDELRANHNFQNIVGHSTPMQEVIRLVRLVAPTDTSVLITGETGTGKELIARAIHESSPRQKQNLVKLNCAAVPAQLMESELFGHEKGAFTGAHQRRIGKFELAHQGTIFLDEIGEMPLELQAKLLRVLQEKEFERLGSNQVLQTDIRILAATNRNLLQEVKRGNFRGDLYYRLNVFPLPVPPLRDRPEDIPALAEYFLNKFSKKVGKKKKKLSPENFRTLLNYAWPGNVRELEHIIERTLIVSEEEELSFNLPSDKIPPKFPISANHTADEKLTTYRQAEIDLIMRTLQFTKGKISGPGGAAEILAIHPATLESKMRKFNIKRKHIVEE